MINKQFYNYTNKVLQWIVIFAAIIFLSYQLYTKNLIWKDLQHFLSNFSSFQLYAYFLIVLLLMPFNWLIESFKWKLLIQKKEEISILNAIKAVISGITISSITPNRVGEFVARLFVLKKTRFWEGVFITIIGSSAQTLITLILGITSFIIFIPNCRDCVEQIPYYSIGMIFFVLMGIIAVSGLLILYFRIGSLYHLIPKKWKKIRFYSMTLKQFTFNELAVALGFSLLRYFIFSFQFVLLFAAFQLEISLIHAFALISIVFFMNTVIPSIALLELGIRGSIAIFVFKYYFEIYQHRSFDFEFEVFVASGLLWFINIVIPAICGLFFIQKLNFLGFKNENDMTEK